MNIESYLSEILAKAFNKLGYTKSLAKVIASTRKNNAHFQCNSAMPLSKYIKKPPSVIAKTIVNHINDEDIFAELKITEPGFINITLTLNFLANITNICLNSKKFGVENNSKIKKVILDFGGPNIAKPMHVGHIRSTLLGDSLQRINRFYNNVVISDVHLGDWGIQIGMLIEEIKLRFPELVYFNENYTGSYPNESPVSVQELAEIYPQASKKCKSDIVEMEKAKLATFQLQQGRKGYIALWQHFIRVSLETIKKDFNSLDIHFDLWLGESDANKFINKMINYLKSNNFIYKNEGAWVVDTDKDNIPPLIIVKENGGVMYGTTDLATLWQRNNDFNPDEIIYVVDKRQSLHFNQVFSVAKKTKIINEKCQLKHIAFGTINGKDGRPFKTRDGGVMSLTNLILQVKAHTKQRIFNEQDKDLIHQISMATIKFGDLVNNYSNDYIFDINKFSKHEGKTGPYILYTAVRAKSILRKIFGKKYNIEFLIKDYKIINANNEYEEKLQLQLIRFPISILKSYENSQPHYICEYIYTLANIFNKFYVNCPIININNDESLKKARIALCIATIKAITIASNLLGIYIPEEM